MEIDENELVRAARDGDAEAFEQIVRIYMPKAQAFIRQMTNSSEDVQDLAQEAFIKAYRGLGSFKGESSFKTWFFRVLSNICLDHLRKGVLLKRFFFFSTQEENDDDEGILERAPDTAPNSRPDDSILNKELGAALNKAMSALPERQRAVFFLRHSDGMKLTEVAAVLGITEGAVKSHLVRAVASLRKSMKGYG